MSEQFEFPCTKSPRLRMTTILILLASGDRFAHIETNCSYTCRRCPAGDMLLVLNNYLICVTLDTKMAIFLYIHIVITF